MAVLRRLVRQLGRAEELMEARREKIEKIFCVTGLVTH